MNYDEIWTLLKYLVVLEQFCWNNVNNILNIINNTNNDKTIQNNTVSFLQYLKQYVTMPYNG